MLPLRCYSTRCKSLRTRADPGIRTHAFCACYGSRKAQPLRVRKFIELAVQRFTSHPDLTLSAGEL